MSTKPPGIAHPKGKLRLSINTMSVPISAITSAAIGGHIGLGMLED
jgi:hypothetical protein